MNPFSNHPCIPLVPCHSKSSSISFHYILNFLASNLATSIVLLCNLSLNFQKAYKQADNHLKILIFFLMRMWN
uniref:Uncharacterized protein n=1 Tax=Rhizophora mucronata TaxID=61149 RepID=A0A2P2R1J1_RHIMU